MKTEPIITIKPVYGDAGFVQIVPPEPNQFLRLGGRDRLIKLYQWMGANPATYLINDDTRFAEVSDKRWAELLLLVMAGHAILANYPREVEIKP